MKIINVLCFGGKQKPDRGGIDVDIVLAGP